MTAGVSTRSRLPAAVAICAAAVIPICQAQVAIEPRPVPPAKTVQPRPNLRADSNLVLVPVAVVDQRNHPVTGLTKENFRVFDDGAERTITAFAMEDEPIAAGLVFDHSSSVASVMRDESAATRLFLQTSNPADDYFLVVFASKPKLAVPMTHGAREVQYRVFNIQSTGSTALYDAVVLGLNELKKSSLTRKALLIVSDGGENNSRYSRNEVRRIVEEADALIYAISFNTWDANFSVLRWMAELSGGRVIPARPQELSDIAGKIGLELRNRYVLGYPAGEIPRDGKFHNLRVQLIPPHGMPPLKASWRRGYRAPDDSIR
jgi:VWFA-related protein